MQLGGYTKDRQVRVSAWVALVVGLLWGYGALRSFDGADEYVADDGEEIYLLYADREMRLLDGLQSFPGWLHRWVEGDAGERDVVVEELLETLRDGEELGLVGEEGAQVRAVLYWAAGSAEEARAALEAGWDKDSALCVVLRDVMLGKPLSAPGMLRELEDRVSSGQARAWEGWVVRFASAGAGESPAEVFALYERQNRALTWRLLAALTLPGLCVLAGLVSLVIVLSRCSTLDVPPGHPVIRLWSAPLVLTVFFGADYTGGLVADALAVAFSGIEVWPIWLELFWDCAWRITPVVLVAMFLFNRPVHLLRVFGLNRPGHWMAALAMLSVLWSWDWVLAFFPGDGEFFPVQPQDFIPYADPSPGELGLDVFTGCVSAPLVEEIMFRGLLFMGLRPSIGPWMALVVSSILFGVAHWQYDAFGVLSVMLLGAGNAVLVWRTGSLFPAVLVHAAYNFLVTVMVVALYQWPL